MSPNLLRAANSSRSELLREFYEAPEDTLFDQKTVAAVKNCSTAKLERDRWAGTGIPFLKDGQRVLYRKADVIADLARLPRYQSTSEDPETARRSEQIRRRKAEKAPAKQKQRGDASGDAAEITSDPKAEGSEGGDCTGPGRPERAPAYQGRVKPGRGAV